MSAVRMSEEKQRGLRLLPGGQTRERREEDALLGAWLVGDDEAFGELVARHQPLVLRLVRRYAASPEDARDLCQRTFLRAFESARRALGRGPRGAGQAVPFRRWLVRVALNLAKNHRRDETRWSRLPVAGGGAPAATSGSPTEGLERAEQAVRLRRAVLALPRRQREVVTLRLDAELPFAEIAEALGIAEGAARVAFHHALLRLRAGLGRESP
jgi:RNA polymerase sigma-70 factor (ECF subfamily)